MASLILSTAGNALFGPIGGAIGAIAGSAIDSAAITALTPARVQPSRLAGLKVQASQEGAPIPIVYGRFRVTGQVIWASKFEEVNTKRTVGGKGGQRVIERSYTISFAIGLCEGPIDGIGKVWANGNLLDLSTLAHRVYLGGESQMPDPLIEALEGLALAPAFRGLAYIVFEDMPVSGFGDRIPQLAFEVMASPPLSPGGASHLKELARGVCLIPGAGEFAYATTPVRKIIGPGEEVGENVHAQAGRADFDVALDNLTRDFPAVDAVSLVVAWFGTDLRAGNCQILPKVEDRTKQTSPMVWSVAGLTRTTASLVSRYGDKPAYGGSPDDASVIEAIIALKSRGIKVTHNPFVMMDIAPDNTLSNPLGGTSQPPYPWRGRITCFPGIGQSGTVDASVAATTQVNSFFGSVTASHFSVTGTTLSYNGPNQWSYRRFILHQAALCKAAGGVESFLIGSELIGLTRVRGAGGSFPAVAALIDLAAEVRALLGPDVKISYGADWTEYGGYKPPGTDDLRFPLDPLWANANLDYIGLDWYAPITDRRDGDARPNLASLQSGIEGGEAYDFYYASDTDRVAKTRLPITDATYQEPWVWRQKDIRGFWSNAHYERTGGVRATTPTAWIAKSKPIALMELGFPAVDKGANRPSVFPDPKSVESGLPPFSNGARDDGEQRLALEATLAYWRDHNPSSTLYAGDMMDLSRFHLWAWDGRPYPQFPALVDLWSDGMYAMLGHWLAGRGGRLSLGQLVGDICRRGGLEDVDVGGIGGYVDGFAIEAPTSPRALLENLFAAFGLEAVSRSTGLIVSDTRPPISSHSLTSSDTLIQNSAPALGRTSHNRVLPSAGRFSAYASERDYQPASVTTPVSNQEDGPINALASPLVVDAQTRASIAHRLARTASGDGLMAQVGPALAAKLEAGDRIALSDGGVWRVDRMEGRWSQDLVASRAPQANGLLISNPVVQTPVAPTLYAAPVLAILDITAPFTSDTAPRPLVGAASSTWAGDVDILLDSKIIGTLTKPMTSAFLVNPLPKGPVGRFIKAPLLLSPAFGASLPSSGQGALMVGGDVLDIISWRGATLVSADTWRLEDWVRGLSGTSIGPAIAAGGVLIVLDDALQEMPIDPGLVGVSLTWQARPVADITRIGSQNARFDGLARLAWSPCQCRASRRAAGIFLSWTRRARGTGDGWGIANAALGAHVERYILRIKSNAGAVLRTSTETAPNFHYLTADEIADFGAPQSRLRVEIVQIGDDDLVGRPTEVVLAI
jgi:GTA TIM-barrel-like domain/Putative phage tail protein